jgi:hypothetical protein
VILFLITMEMSSQERRILPEEFIGIEISRGLRTNLIPSNENKVIISGKGIKKITAQVVNGILKVSGGQAQMLNTDDTIIDIYFKYILVVEARHNSRVYFTKKLKQPLLKLKAREGASIFADLEVENIVANSLTGGSITVTGKAAIQEVEVKSGTYRGENLIGENINVVLNGNGTANIFAKKYVNAMALAGGQIYIYGNPREIHEKTSFGGSIKKIN